MNRRKETADNPYRVPSSELDPRIENWEQWSVLATKCAEKSSRCTWFGLITALFGFTLTVTVLGVSLNHFSEITIETRSIDSILIAYVLVIIFGFPYSKLYIRFQRRKYSAEKYVEYYQKTSQRFFCHPLFLTIAIPFGSVVHLLTWESIRNWKDLDQVLLSVGSAVMVVLPIALPLVYFLLKRTMRKSSKLVEQMVRKID